MIDLQLHTTDSDGTWDWEDVLNRCLELGLKAFSITDHDTVIRHPEIRAWAVRHQAMAIPGVELSTTEQSQTVHLLGYFLDKPTLALEKKLAFLRSARRKRNRKILARLGQLGFHVASQELDKLAGQGTPGRPHIARLLFQKGFVASIKEAFDRFLAVGAQAYFPKDEIPLREGIDLLHQSGAVTSVAHPILLNRSWDQLDDSLKLWAKWGLDAVEAYYPAYQSRHTAFLIRMAHKYHLLLTGGSDFHGENKPHIKIGSGTGSLRVPDDLLEPLFARHQEICR